MTDGTERIRFDQSGDAWYLNPDGTWTPNRGLAGIPRAEMELAYGPTVEYVPATRITKLEQQIADLTADWGHEYAAKLDEALALLRRLAAAATSGGAGSGEATA